MRRCIDMTYFNETPEQRAARVNAENHEANMRELVRQAEAQQEKNRRDYYLWAPYKDALTNTGGNLVTHNHPYTECPSRMNWSPKW